MRRYYCIALCKVQKLYDDMVQSVNGFEGVAGQIEWIDKVLRGDWGCRTEKERGTLLRQKKVLEEMKAEDEAIIFQKYGVRNIYELKVMIRELESVLDRLTYLEEMERKKESDRKAHKKGIRSGRRK